MSFFLRRTQLYSFGFLEKVALSIPEHLAVGFANSLPPSNHPSIREQCRVEENGEENGVTTSSIYSYTLRYLVFFTLFLKWGLGGGLLV